MFLEQVSLKKSFFNLDLEEKFRAYRKLWKLSGEYKIITDFPLHLDLELSGKCNFKCPECFQNGLIKGKLDNMNTDLFKKIITQGVENGLCAIKLQIRGESFLHPKIFDMIKFAKARGILDVQITTNGSLLNREKMDLLLESGIDALIFSIDAHHDINLKKSKENSKEELINYILSERKNQNLQKPWVRIRSSVPYTDINESTKTKSILEKKFPLADLYIVGRIHNFRDDEDAYPDLHTNYTLNKCAYPTQRLAVFWDGNTTTCCMDYNHQFDLGNAAKEDIKDIWQSRTMDTLRKKHLNGERSSMPICRHCHACIRPLDKTIYNDDTPRHGADTN